MGKRSSEVEMIFFNGKTSKVTYGVLKLIAVRIISFEYTEDRES